MKILIADKLELRAEDAGHSNGVEIVDKAGIAPAELAEIVGGFDALIVRSRTKVDAAIIARGERLKAIGRAGTGVDNIDVGAATRRGVLVMNVPGGNSNAAAEHTIAMLLASARRIAPAHAAVLAGNWQPAKFTGVEVAGKTLGVLGLGRIGLLVAQKARGLGMKVIGYDPVIAPLAAADAGVELLPVDDVVGRADFLTVHVPLGPDTVHLIDARRLALAKTGVRIVNCARGGIIDEAALAAAIRAKKVAGAALDVFEAEPPPADSPLLALPEVLATPHLGASTVEAQQAVSRAILAQTIEYLSGGPAVGAVNGFTIDGPTRDQVMPFFELARRLGRVAAGLGAGVGRLTARYYGPIAKKNVRALTAYFLKGYLSQALGEDISELAAYGMAAERGMTIEELTRDEHRSFQSLLYFTIDHSGVRSAVAGTVFGKRSLRVVRLGGTNLDAVPEGWMLIVRNRDMPGVVGRIGQALGEAHVNIAHMSLGRETANGEALAVLNLDSKPPASVLVHLRSMPDIIAVDLVNAE